jgi:hypothetical protein
MGIGNVRCEDCAKQDCPIRGIYNAMPCIDYEYWNIFALYSSNVSPDGLAAAKQATLEIKAAVDEAGKKLHGLCEKYGDIGANDTASLDEILHLLGKKARGWVP